jgi:hypothetical protein
MTLTQGDFEASAKPGSVGVVFAWSEVTLVPP